MSLGLIGDDGRESEKQVIVQGIGFGVRAGAVALTVLLIAAEGVAFAAAPDRCTRVILDGDVRAGQEWKASIGGGWVFRVVPIPPLTAGYTGWDLVVDRESPAGFPDALYVATPPYRSIGEREIGTTFGLRAQDAIGWNPRSFRFLTDAAALREAQPLYRAAFGGASPATDPNAAMPRLQELARHASSGELRIVDARIAPGIADPAPFARAWAIAGERMQHEVEASADGMSSPRGALRWMRFTITLWLPSNWQAPPGVKSSSAACVP